MLLCSTHAYETTSKAEAGEPPWGREFYSCGGTTEKALPWRMLAVLLLEVVVREGPLLIILIAEQAHS